MSYELEEQICGTDPVERKNTPVYSGFLTYFPDAIAAVSRLSLENNQRHNPDSKELKWNKEASSDHKDALVRHIMDGDWVEVAWRAMANLQIEIETKKGEAIK